MPNRSRNETDLAGVLSREKVFKTDPGFQAALASTPRQGQYAKALASAYLKFVQPSPVSELDSVQHFISLFDTHQDLVTDAAAYLRREIPFIYEDQPLQPLLVGLAGYRLKQLQLAHCKAVQENASDERQAELAQHLAQVEGEYQKLLDGPMTDLPL